MSGRRDVQLRLALIDVEAVDQAEVERLAGACLKASWMPWACPDCDESNDHDAKYCVGCGVKKPA